MAYQRNYRSLKRVVDSWLSTEAESSSDAVLEGVVAARSSNLAHEQMVVDIEAHEHCNPADDTCSFPVDFDSDCLPVSSSDDDSDEQIDADDVASTLQCDLGEWTAKYPEVCRSACNDLLSVLRRHGLKLPRDSRTLKKMPRVVNVIKKCGGQDMYFWTLNILLCCDKKMLQEPVFVQVNIDIACV